MAVHSVTVEHTLGKLLEEKRYTAIRDVLITMNPADIFERTVEDYNPVEFGHCLQAAVKF